MAEKKFLKREPNVPKKEKEVVEDQKPRETTVEFLASLAGVLVTGLFIIKMCIRDRATSEALFHRFPEFQEGHLSKLRAHLVGQRHLLRVAEQFQIGQYMRLGRGEEKSGGRNKANLLVDALEAILAALYLSLIHI